MLSVQKLRVLISLKMERKRYREYLKCSEKKIPERSWRRYRNETGEPESDMSCSTDLEMAAEVCELGSESETEGNLTLEIGDVYFWYHETLRLRCTGIRSFSPKVR